MKPRKTHLLFKKNVSSLTFTYQYVNKHTSNFYILNTFKPPINSKYLHA